MFASTSEYPFTQTITDLNKGGVAWYCEGKTQAGKWIVVRRVFDSMQSFYDFLGAVVGALPAECGYQKGRHPVIVPEELQQPKRVKFITPRGASQASAALAALHDLVYGVDVANFDDLDDWGPDGQLRRSRAEAGERFGWIAGSGGFPSYIT
jgi:hypothetical protein